jgi:hypothetical protein
MDAFENDNFIPDDAFEARQSTPTQLEEGHEVNAFGSDVLKQKDYKNMTQAEQFQAVKDDVYQRHGVDQSVKGPTIADQIKHAEQSKVTQHSDGSITVTKGVMRNDSASTELLKMLRDKAYQLHNVTD